MRVGWMTQHLMNVFGLGLGSLKRRVTLKQLLDTVPLFAEKQIQKTEVKYTRADYEDIKKKHAALHKQIWEEQQRS